MRCKNTCRLCNKLVISTAVAFDAATNSLNITIPAGNYQDGCKYCLVVAQAIPAETTINALVSILISTDTTQYPLTNRNCAQVTACSIRTRTKYSAKVDTNATGGVFRLLGDVCCSPDNSLASIPAPAVTPAG